MLNNKISSRFPRIRVNAVCIYPVNSSVLKISILWFWPQKWYEFSLPTHFSLFHLVVRKRGVLFSVYALHSIRFVCQTAGLTTQRQCSNKQITLGQLCLLLFLCSLDTRLLLASGTERQHTCVLRTRKTSYILFVVLVDVMLSAQFNVYADFTVEDRGVLYIRVCVASR